MEIIDSPKSLKIVIAKQQKEKLCNCLATAEHGRQTMQWENKCNFFCRFSINDNTRYMSHVNDIEHVQIKSLI